MSASRIALIWALSALPALAEAPRVVADIPPVASLVTQVMQGVGTPQVLIGAGGDAHHHQMRPSEARAVANADLLIWVGPAMTPWLEQAGAALGPAHQLVLLDLPQTIRRETGEGEAAHDHDHDHDHAHDDDHDHGHHHDHGPIDPHAWLDPQNGRLWLDAIAEALAAQDPANAAIYRANAAQGRAAITAAEDEARGLLAGVTQPIVVGHDAYGYFTEAMGLPDALAIADLSDNAPSAAALRGLRARIAASDAVCAFPEAGAESRGMLAATEGQGLRLGAQLDPEGMTLTAGAGLYPALLLGLAQAIGDCARE